MKKLKLLICLTLALMLALNFASCERSEQPADSSEETPRETSSATDSSEITKSEEEIEAEQTDTYITDIKYWDKLGISTEDSRYTYINAFLEGDTATLEDLIWLSGLPAEGGIYDEYKAIQLGENYSITKETDKSGNTRIWLHFTVTESGTEYFTEGDYSLIVEEGMWGTHLCDLEYLRNLSENNNAGGDAYMALRLWLSSGYEYLLPDYAALSGQRLEYFNRFAAEYIFSAFSEEVGADNWTPAILQAYIKKYIGIDNFPTDSYWMKDGVYDLSYTAHGLHSWLAEFLGEVTDGDITTITLQFFAEPSYTIKSHIVEYRLQYVDGGYKFLSSEITDKAKYEPANYQS